MKKQHSPNGAVGSGGTAGSPAAPPAPSLSEKQRGELWLYIAVSIVAVELLILVGAVCYAFIRGGREPGQAFVFAFPWVPYAVVAVLVPVLILLLVHLADVGLFRSPGGAASEAEWQKLLPGRMQRLYRIVKGAPAVVVLLGLVLLGVAVLTLDGAIDALARFGSVLLPYVPHIVGGVAGFGVALVLAIVWLHYRTRRLIAEYDFRREVLEKTGVIIVDKGSAALPPGGIGDVPYALVSGTDPDAIRPKALPPSPDPDLEK